MPGVAPVSWADLTDGRTRIAAFVRDCGGLDRVEAFIAKVAESDYLAGRLDLPAMDLFTAMTKYDRIMAGGYANRTSVHHDERSPNRPELRDIRAQVESEAGERALAEQERAARAALKRGGAA